MQPNNPITPQPPLTPNNQPPQPTPNPISDQGTTLGSSPQTPTFLQQSSPQTITPSQSTPTPPPKSKTLNSKVIVFAITMIATITLAVLGLILQTNCHPTNQDGKSISDLEKSISELTPQLDDTYQSETNAFTNGDMSNYYSLHAKRYNLELQQDSLKRERNQLAQTSCNVVQSGALFAFILAIISFVAGFIVFKRKRK